MTSTRTHLRVAAIGDLHVSRHSQGTFQPLFTQISGSADVLALCGDFTDYGLPDEARVLARLRTPQRIAVMHYAPIRGTVEGEPPEIFAYCGSSRLEEPINRYRVSAVFHGHAHRGSPEGRTSTGIPVYNVAMPLLTRVNPDRPPYLIVEFPIAQDSVGVGHPPSGVLASPVTKSA